MEIFPAYQPVYSATKKSDPIVRSSVLGGSYQHRTSFGINQNRKEWSLTFNLSESDANIVEQFLDLHAEPQKAFAWIPPNESSYYKWICPSWSREFADLDRSLITVTFRQVFDLIAAETPIEPEPEGDDYYYNMSEQLYSWKYPFYLDWWGN